MHVGNAVGQIEGDTGGVDNAAGDRQVKGCFTQVGHQVGRGERDQPAHGHIDADPCELEAVLENHLQHHAGDRQ